MVPQAGDPEVIFCVEFGPLNLQPRPGPAVGRGERPEQVAGITVQDPAHALRFRCRRRPAGVRTRPRKVG
jgi:hypothetical protein